MRDKPFGVFWMEKLFGRLKFQTKLVTCSSNSTRLKTINVKQKFTTFSKHWHPHQIAIVDDMQVLLAKIKGDFMWHKHEDVLALVICETDQFSVACRAGAKFFVSILCGVHVPPAHDSVFAH